MNETRTYIPASTDVTKNLHNVNASKLTGDVTHTINNFIAESADGARGYHLSKAAQISFQLKWSDLSATDAVFQVKTRLSSDMDFTCENTDETTTNATQKTLSTASGTKIIHLAPANYQDIQMFLDKNSIATGTIDVVVLLKF